MRIGLTFNLKPPGATGDRFEEFDSEETIDALERALAAQSHQPVRLGWGEPMLDALAHQRIDGVFNLAEGIGGRGRESQVPAILEMLGIPCTASSALAIGLTLDKALAKTVAKAAGIATAPFVVRESGSLQTPHPGAHHVSHNPLPAGEGGPGAPAAGPGEGPEERITRLRFPLFCKPCNEGSSMGITAKSLCRNEAELDRTIKRLSQYGPVLVEEFLPGEEYTVGIVGGEPVGVMQVRPQKPEENFIYSLEVKRDYLNRVEYVVFRDAELEKVALDVWRAFDLRDVARVDLRRDRDGVPNFVEVNPLPGLNPVYSDLVILATRLGWQYDELIARIMDSAIKRWGVCAS